MPRRPRRKTGIIERLATTLDIFDSKEGLLLSVLSDSKFFQGQQNYENDGESRRIVNTGNASENAIVKHHEAL